MVAITGLSAAADSSDIPLEYMLLPVVSNLLSDSFERAWGFVLAPQLTDVVTIGKMSRDWVVNGAVELEEVLENQSV